MCFDFFTPGMTSSGHAPGNVTYFEKNVKTPKHVSLLGRFFINLMSQF